MFVIKREDGLKQYSIVELKRDNPNTSFPKDVSSETLTMYDVYPASLAERPVIDSITHVTLEGDWHWVEDEYVQSWLVEKRPIEDVEKSLRSKRNELLSDCDYTQLNDFTGDKEAWVKYRQELRDLPEQEGFPYDYVIPESP